MQIQDAFNDLVDKVMGWLAGFILLLPNLAVAALVAVGFGVLSRIVRSAVMAAMSRMTSHPSIKDLMGTVAGFAVLVTGIFVALGIVGLDKTVTSLLAGVGIIGLALGFAFQDIASNFMSGIILMIRQPFTHDDLIETNGTTGLVKRIDLRTTVLHTLDGKVVVVPNSQVANSVLVNYTVSGRRRVDLGVGVSYGDDLETVRRVTIEAVEGSGSGTRTKPLRSSTRGSAAVRSISWYGSGSLRRGSRITWPRAAKRLLRSRRRSTRRTSRFRSRSARSISARSAAIGSMRCCHGHCVAGRATTRRGISNSHSHPIEVSHAGFRR